MDISPSDLAAQIQEEVEDEFASLRDLRCATNNVTCTRGPTKLVVTVSLCILCTG